MDRSQTINATGRIFMAAGRSATKGDYEVWHEALSDVAVSDSEVTEATQQFIRNTESRELINISRFRHTLLAIVKRRNERDADERGLAAVPPTPPEQAKQNLAKLREAMASIGKSA